LVPVILKLDYDGREIDPSQGLRSPELMNLFQLWRSRHRGDALPRRGDFAAEEFMKFSGRVALIDVEHERFRLRFRLVGTLITNILERDSTGRYLDELYDPVYYARVADYFRTIVDERRALRTIGDMAQTRRRHVQAEVIDLPLAGDGDRVDVILRGVDLQ
jgi:hypothetical protein